MPNSGDRMDICIIHLAIYFNPYVKAVGFNFIKIVYKHTPYLFNIYASFGRINDNDLDMQNYGKIK